MRRNSARESGHAILLHRRKHIIGEIVSVNKRDMNCMNLIEIVCGILLYKRVDLIFKLS